MSCLLFYAIETMRLSSRFVFVNPGKMLLTVILYCPNSFAIVLDQEATAPRTVFEIPKLFIGIFIEVEIIFIIRP